MLEWAGNDRVLAQHAGVAETTISKARRSLGVEPADRRYRGRANYGAAQALEETPAFNANPTAERLAELKEYFENRTVPPAPGPTAAKGGEKYASALAFADLHYPHHHERAFEVVLGLIDTMQPDEVILGGDAFDFSQLGHYPQDPNCKRHLQDDIDECRVLLSRVTAAAPNATRRFIVGNHEDGRWSRYLWNKSPELASLRCLTMEAVLGLTELGWVWQPFEYWPTDALIVFHGDRHTSMLGGGSAASARKEHVDMGCSGVTFHTHHAGVFYRQDRTGYYVWTEGGCVCDWHKMQAAGVTSQRTPVKGADWHLACVRILYRPGHSAFHTELIPILQDARRTFAIYQDQEIVA